MSVASGNHVSQPTVRWPLWIGVAALCVVVVLGWRLLNRASFHGVLLQTAQPAADFALDSSTGTTVRLSDYRGKVVLIFFGYTSCPDVCPLTLAEIAQAVQRLGDQAAGVQTLLITVDPANDTPPRLAAYLAAFEQSFVGLTGTPAAIQAVATQLGVYASSGPSQTQLAIEHTSSILVLDPQGRVRLLWPPQIRSAEMAADLRQLLNPSLFVWE